MDERDSDWFTSTYARNYVDIVRYGARRLADLDAANELAQEVFAVAWRRRTEVPDRSLPWLYGVARNLIANRRRQPAEQVVVVDPVGLSDVDAGTAEPVGSQAAAAVADVRAALARLAEPDQEILRLIGWEELTVGEAAQVLGCSRTAAGVRLHRPAAACAPNSNARTHPWHRKPCRPPHSQGDEDARTQIPSASGRSRARPDRARAADVGRGAHRVRRRDPAPGGGDRTAGAADRTAAGPSDPPLAAGRHVGGAGGRGRGVRAGRRRGPAHRTNRIKRPRRTSS